MSMIQMLDEAVQGSPRSPRLLTSYLVMSDGNGLRRET